MLMPNPQRPAPNLPVVASPMEPKREAHYLDGSKVRFSAATPSAFEEEKYGSSPARAYPFELGYR
jgi:hypothetical protein